MWKTEDRKYLKYLRQYWEIQTQRLDFLKQKLNFDTISFADVGGRGKPIGKDVPLSKEDAMLWNKMMHKSNSILDNLKDIGAENVVLEKLNTEYKSDYEHLSEVPTYYAVLPMYKDKKGDKLWKKRMMIEVNGKAYKVQKHLNRFVQEVRTNPEYESSFDVGYVMSEIYQTQPAKDDFPESYKTIRDMFVATADADTLQDNIFEEIEEGVYRLKIDYFFI